MDVDYVSETSSEENLGIEFDDLEGSDGSVEEADEDQKIAGELLPSRVTTNTAYTLYEQVKNGMIDVNPPYQREVVWSASAQSRILESYIKNYHVPPIVLAKKTVFENGKWEDKRVCIDGKQRLTSLKHFFDGRIPYINPDEDGEKKTHFYYQVTKYTPPRKGKLLPSLYRTRMKNKAISIVEYEDLEESQERLMFQRVQFGKALTPSEKIAALTGPIPDFIHNMVARLRNDFCSNVHMNFANKAVFGNMARMVWSINQLRRTGAFAVPNENTLTAWMQDENPVNGDLKKLTKDVISKLNKLSDASQEYIRIAFGPASELPIASDPAWIKAMGRKETKAQAGKLSPMEFICAGLLVAKYGSKVLLTPLAEAIKGFRNVFQEKHFGKKMVNASVLRSFRDWEHQWSESVMDAETEVEVPTPTPSPPPKSKSKKMKKRREADSAPVSKTAPSTTPKKRKRVVETTEEEGQLEDDSDFEPAPKKKASKKTPKKVSS